MKKFKIILFLILLIPFNVLACPHVDKDGNSHFQFYNEDYTEMNMMYPKENYLYTKNIVNVDNIITDPLELLDESFGFPLVQDKDGYVQNYYFIDKRVQSENWNDLEIKTTVEDINNMLVSGKNYNLNVNLNNTYENSKEYNDGKIFQMYYNIFVNRLNDNKEESFNIDKIVKNNKLNQVVPEILDIKATYSIMDTEEYDYNFETIDINSFYDEIEVQVISDKKEEAMVINLKRNVKEEDIIECIYNENTNSYNFIITEPGIYVIVEKEILENEIIFDNKQGDNHIWLILLGFGGILTLLTIWVVINIKKLDK